MHAPRADKGAPFLNGTQNTVDAVGRSGGKLSLKRIGARLSQCHRRLV
jgi:hypothetical protein